MLISFTPAIQGESQVLIILKRTNWNDDCYH
jgi:hypothetical protein